MYAPLSELFSTAGSVLSGINSSLMARFPQFFKNTLADDMIFMVIVLYTVGYWLRGVLIDPRKS